MRRANPVRRIAEAVRSWLRARGGGVAIVLAVSTPVLIMLVGLAIDYARAENARAKLQHAADMASLALARFDDSYNDPTDAATRFIKANLKDHDLDLDALQVKATVTATQNSKSAKIDVSASPELYFANFFSRDAFDVDVFSTSTEEYQHLEISMVLDVSGSMATGDKIGKLRDAATDFLNIMLKSPIDEQFTTISIVPYASDVNVGPAFSKFVKAGERSGWNGCVDLGKTPLTGQVLSLGASSATPDIWGPGSICPQGGRVATFRQNSLTALTGHVAGLTAGGRTSTDMATQWGLSALQPEWRPHLPGPDTSAPRDYDADVAKTLIIMTDGAINQPYRMISGMALPLYDTNFAIGRLRTLCQTAKDEGVHVYTIGFEVGTPWMLDLLKECSSGEGYYFEPVGTQISDVFKAIAFRLSPLRLTQ